MAVELKIPNAGESITEVQIGEWRKRAGEFVARDEIVVEIETDKASMGLPAPVSGKISKVLKAAGASATVGEVIGLIEEGADGPADGQPPAAKSPANDTAQRGAAQEPAAPSPSPAAEIPRTETLERRAPHIMPAARRELAERGLAAEQVESSGPGNRLLKEDVLRHASSAAASPPAAPPAGHSVEREEELVPMSLIRRRIAERLVQSQQSAALLTTFNEIDMSGVQQLRRQLQDRFLEKYGVKLGFMSFFVKAAIDALKLVPQVNAEIRGSDIVYKNYFDIGVAVGGGRGLVVPVLRNAERLSFAEIEVAIGNFAQRAKENKLTVEELQGGTFTISNGGVYGSLLSTPIVNPPQSGILGLHAIQDRPVVRDGGIVARPMMYVALTYDHRLVDGREAVTFLKRIKECVEDPARMLVEV